jgi:hypothetical protein
MLVLPGRSWIAPQLWLWKVSSSPNKMGQFSFVHHPQSHEINSVIHHAPALGGWLLTPSPLSALVLHLAPTLRIWLLTPPPFSEVGSAFHSIPAVSSRSYSMSVSFSFVGVGCAICLWAALDCVLGRVCGAWYSPVGFADLCRQLWTSPAGKDGRWLFSKQSTHWDWVQTSGA